MPPKKLIQQVLKQLRERLFDKKYKFIYDQDNKEYFVHRAIEALQMKEYYLACQLILILIVQEQKEKAC